RLEAGDHGAFTDGDTLARLTPHRPTAHEAWYGAVVRAMRVSLAGDFAEAERLIAQALNLGSQAQIPDAFQSFGVQLAFVRREQGRFEELEAPLRGLVEQYPATPAWRTALAILYAEAGRE